MVSYNNSDVVQCLRQYDMFANSLRLIRSNEEKMMIIKQLTKLENKILSLTNDVYEEEYQTLVDKECALLDEEKERVTMLIELINQRLTYVEKRCNNHYVLTGETIDVPNVLGVDTLDMLEDRVKVIDKYSKNVKLEKELKEDIVSLSNKISLASEKIDINKSLNYELETTFKKVVDDALNKLNIYGLTDSKDDIEYAYYETEKSLRLAESNLEVAKTSPMNILTDCEKMLSSVKDDYFKYKEQISFLKLIDIFNSDITNYDELLAKRQEINEILKYINNQEFLDMVEDTISKQYNTILMEQQDINTFNDLVLEKERKTNALTEIDEENNSDRFQNILKVLIENEKKRQQKIIEEQRRIEEIEKKKKLEIERRRQEEILKRQKIIEEARKKEIEKRTKQLLEEQQNSVLQAKKKEKEQHISFETIKDISNNEQEKSIPIITREERKNLNTLNGEINLDSFKQDDEFALSDDDRHESQMEKELFEEFNNKREIDSFDEKNEVLDEDKINFFDRIDEVNDNKAEVNKFPDMSIDEYMRQFDEDRIDQKENIFADDVFPTIPM